MMSQGKEKFRAAKKEEPRAMDFGSRKRVFRWLISLLHLDVFTPARGALNAFLRLCRLRISRKPVLIYASISLEIEKQKKTVEV